jgi:hypothetical protein
MVKIPLGLDYKVIYIYIYIYREREREREREFLSCNQQHKMDLL